jgi:hypothetical protein
VFSGGSYNEVGRWVRMFLTSHAKREHPRVEVVMDDDEALQGQGYRARLLLGRNVSEPIALDFAEVAAQRGTLAWCAALATRTRAQARGLLAAGGASDARAR